MHERATDIGGGALAMDARRRLHPLSRFLDTAVLFDLSAEMDDVANIWKTHACSDRADNAGKKSFFPSK